MDGCTGTLGRPRDAVICIWICMDLDLHGSGRICMDMDLHGGRLEFAVACHEDPTWKACHAAVMPFS